jgi:cobalt-zinc-cadmium efflux system outer membrane protein
MRAIAALLLGALSLLPAVVAGQPSGTTDFTVDELVARALAENGELRAVRAEVDAAVGRLRQAGFRPNPMLDLGGQQNVAGPDNNITIGLTLPLDLNGRKEGRVGVAERELELKRAQLADRERKLRAEVRAKAGELLAARRNLGFTEELLQVNRRALDVVGERARLGAVPALDAALTHVEVNRLDASRAILASRVEILALQLRALTGFAPAVPLSLKGDLNPVPVWLDRAAGVARALAKRGDAAAARAEVATALARIRKERAEGRWDASVSVGYQRQETGFGLMGITDRGGTRAIQDTFHFVGGGLSITLPLRNRNEGNVSAAAAEARAAERRLEFLTLVIRQEVEAAFTQWEAAERALAIYARGVRELARQNLDVVRKAYELGRTSLLDVIAEQRRYIEIETGYTESLKLVYDAAAELERALGGTGD